jgi:hypothetical protein
LFTTQTLGLTLKFWKRTNYWTFKWPFWYCSK